MSSDPFHQMVSVRFNLARLISAGALNRIMKELGATLHYDVYGFDRVDEHPIWQSESFAYVTLYRGGEIVDAQEEVDSIALEFPLATIGSEYIPRFVELVEKLSSACDASPEIAGEICSARQILEHLDSLTTSLLEDWGEEPGSKSLRVLIETSL